MQASIHLASSVPIFLSTKTSTSSFSPTLTIFPSKQRIRTSSSSSSTCILSMKAAASASDAPEIDYSSMDSSVFPAEACETLGGVACDVEMFPETKLKQAELAPTTTNTSSDHSVDREYLQYDDNPKTVFIAEACDDLGGEFCEPAYQSGRG